ncbi:hypothetical protein SEA_TARYNEARAL_88 [Mycobacterium phage Tarynearal]|nr:hypothetical protein SEA_TARYNEARAL_88 [Mycobacterium phage Tarynearal]
MAKLVGVYRGVVFRCNECIDFSDYDSTVWWTPGSITPDCQCCGQDWAEGLKA